MANSLICNLFQLIPSSLPQEVFETLAETSTIKIERIISKGHHSPENFWYDQEQTEWVLLLKGQAHLEFEQGIIELNPGDYLTIAAHQKHRVAWTTPEQETLWLVVFYDE